MLYDLICNESETIDQQIIILKKQIETLPEGTIFCRKNGEYYKWFHKTEKKTTYLGKEHKDIAEQLAMKKYLTLQVDDLLTEKTAINSYLEMHKEDWPKAPRLFSNNSEYQRLIQPCYENYSKELSDWVHAPYPKNLKHPELLIHKTMSGNLVRSKSEAIIDMLLYQNHIPFRYENPLELDTITIYPDFTTKHPVTKELIYWEHFGKMDDPDYANQVQSKLHHYINHGIIPGKQLITTYETKEAPLNVRTVQQLIQLFFG